MKENFAKEIEVLGKRTKDLEIFLATKESDLKNTKIEKQKLEKSFEKEKSKSDKFIETIQSDMTLVQEDRKKLENERSELIKENEIIREFLEKLVEGIEKKLHISRENGCGPPGKISVFKISINITSKISKLSMLFYTNI